MNLNFKKEREKEKERKSKRGITPVGANNSVTFADHSAVARFIGRSVVENNPIQRNISLSPSKRQDSQEIGPLTCMDAPMSIKPGVLSPITISLPPLSRAVTQQGLRGRNSTAWIADNRASFILKF